MTGVVIALSILATAGIGGAVLGIKRASDLRKELKDRVELSEEEAIAKASARAKEMILDAKNEVFTLRTKIQEEAREAAKKVDVAEKRALEREQGIDRRADVLNKREDKIESKERSIEQAKKDVSKMRDSLSTKLEEIAQLSREEAKEQLLEDVEQDLRETIARKIIDAERAVKEGAEEESQRIIVDAIESSAVDYVSTATVSTVPIPSEDMKGRIIGREGRNIKAFEKYTGVDVIVDEVPEAVTLSCFDPLRREVAVLTMKKLVSDGRIHPGRIEEIVEKVKRDLAKEVRKTGERLAHDSGVVGLPDEIINLLGRFKFRYSYGQSLVKHTLEVMKIGTALAEEVGADVNLVRKACLLHDLGKAQTHELEGAHHHLSAQIMRKYKMDEKLVNAVEAHHGDIEAKSVEAIIVRIADAISGARPGARVENYEQYVKRIKELEDVAKNVGKEKVKEVFAIHAGREVRVMVNPDVADDNDAKILSYKIAKEIEKTQTYPGTVIVNVIREFRQQETAK